MLLIIKSSNSLVSERGKRESALMRKDPLLFEKYIFGNGQPVCDDDCRIFVNT